MSYQLVTSLRLIAVGLAMSFLATAGCGPAKEPTGSISGNLTFQGEPVDNCKVEFFDPIARRSAGALTDETGAFMVKDLRFAKYLVAVYQATDPHSAGETPFDERVPEKYRNHDTSEITVLIESSEELDFDIEMNE